MCMYSYVFRLFACATLIWALRWLSPSYVVLAVVPDVHFEKDVQPGHNLPLADRVELLNIAMKEKQSNKSTFAAGIAYQVSWKIPMSTDTCRDIYFYQRDNF